MANGNEKELKMQVEEVRLAVALALQMAGVACNLAVAQNEDIDALASRIGAPKLKHLDGTVLDWSGGPDVRVIPLGTFTATSDVPVLMAVGHAASGIGGGQPIGLTIHAQKVADPFVYELPLDGVATGPGPTGPLPRRWRMLPKVAKGDKFTLSISRRYATFIAFYAGTFLDFTLYGAK